MNTQTSTRIDNVITTGYAKFSVDGFFIASLVSIYFFGIPIFGPGFAPVFA